MFIKIDTSPEREKELRRQLVHIQSQLTAIERARQHRAADDFKKTMRDYHKWRKEQNDKGLHLPPIAIL